MAFQRKKVAAALAYVVGAGTAATLMTAAPAFAQDMKVTVTGTSIARVEAETALPVTVLTREDIARTGAVTADQLLNSVAAINTLGATVLATGAGTSTYGQSSISMRGLGASRTLVLVNGRRISPFPGDDGSADNVNAIPISAIDRVEVLRDGASAIYGSDAIAGVVNFILTQSYRGAEASAVKAVDSLVGFLRDLAAKGGATSIHLVAHSMGGRVTSQAVARLAELESARLPLFHQVVLAAPDIDLEAFRQLSAAMTKASGRLTVYASANDVALSFSEMLHSDKRAGKNAAALASVPGVDVVDASGVDSSFIGHQYYGESTSVVSDVFWLLRVGAPPDRRRSLRPLVAGVGKIWQLVTGAPATP